MDTSRKAVATSKKEITTDMIHSFFSKVEEKISADKQALLIGTASEKTMKMYEPFILKDNEAIDTAVLKQKTVAVLVKMFTQYLDELKKAESLPSKIAFALENRTIHTFAIIKDNDTKAAKHLLTAESSVVPQFSPKGFYITTMYYEESEGVNFPSKDYFEFPIKDLK